MRRPGAVTLVASLLWALAVVAVVVGFALTAASGCCGSSEPADPIPAVLGVTAAASVDAAGLFLPAVVAWVALCFALRSKQVHRVVLSRVTGETWVARCPLAWHDPPVGLRGFFQVRRQPVAQIDPDPLRSPEDAEELGLLIGMTGNEQTPWNAVAIKNLKDKRIATGVDDEASSSPGPAGKAAGRIAGRPPQ